MAKKSNVLKRARAAYKRAKSMTNGRKKYGAAEFDQRAAAAKRKKRG